MAHGPEADLPWTLGPSWLIGLRWGAALALLAVVLGARAIGLPLPYAPLLAVVAGIAATNGALVLYDQGGPALLGLIFLLDMSMRRAALRARS